MEGSTAWKQEYYELKQIPDLTLSKYSQLDEGCQLIYEYDPERELGKQLRSCIYRSADRTIAVCCR